MMCSLCVCVCLCFRGPICSEARCSVCLSGSLSLLCHPSLHHWSPWVFCVHARVGTIAQDKPRWQPVFRVGVIANNLYIRIPRIAPGTVTIPCIYVTLDKSNCITLDQILISCLMQCLAWAWHWETQGLLPSHISWLTHSITCIIHVLMTMCAKHSHFNIMCMLIDGRNV